MSDSKISVLTTIVGTSVDSAADFIPIVDSSANETKKITPAELAKSIASNYVKASFTPAFTGLTVVLGGGTVTYNGSYIVIGDLVTWTVRISTTGGATTESVAGTTFINNMPVTIGSFESVCSAVNAGTVASYGNGTGASTSTNMFTPTWPAVSNSIVISGSYFK